MLIAQLVSGSGSLKIKFRISKFLSKQTKCREFKVLYFNTFYLNTNIYIIINKFFNFIKQIYLILVKILNNYLNNPQIINNNKIIIIIYYWISISEATCLLLHIFILDYIHKINNIIFHLNSKYHISNRKYSINSKQDDNQKFNEWLAGLIDGDGYFTHRHINDLTSLQITFNIKDKSTIDILKYHLGGKLVFVKNTKAIRYNLHSVLEIMDLINRINGNIRTPNRIKQLKRICEIYDIEYKEPIKLTYFNGWLSGFFDSDGSISINKANMTMTLSITQKNRLVLDLLAEIYDGKVWSHDKSRQSSRFVISKNNAIKDIVNNYFTIYPSRTTKQSRILLVNKFFELKNSKAHLASKKSDLFKSWDDFMNEWKKY